MTELPDISNIFKKDLKDYTNNVNPVKDYIEQTASILSSNTDVSFDEAKKIVRKELKNNKEIKNPNVVFIERDLNNKTKKTSTGLLSYLDHVKKQGDVVAPSLTVYFNPKKKKSLHSEFTMHNVAVRAKHKKLALAYKMDGKMDLYEDNNILQKTMKIFNNSLSGAYGSSGTILYNLSAHYTLTSITRGMSGIGNAISENMITGTIHYRDPIVTIQHLAAIKNDVNKKEISNVIQKYKLHIPTVDEIMESIVIKNIKRYWRSTREELIIYNFIKKMTAEEKVSVMYTNNLFNLAKFNDALVKKIIGKMINKEKLKDAEYDLNKAPDWVKNLLAHTSMDTLKGKKFIVDSLSKEDREIIEKNAINTLLVMDKVKDLFKAFFIGKIFPPSIAYIKDMVRDSIVLSDTDSTCASYQIWAEWWTGSMLISQETVAVSAIIMTITTQVIDHYIKVFAGNMNVPNDRIPVLSMKNEYFWSTFVSTNVAKHYFAYVNIQEGNVFAKGDLELKGVHLIASQVFEGIRKVAKEMELDILGTVERNEKLSLFKYLRLVAEQENMLIDMALKGDSRVYKLEKIKELNSYKKGDEPFKTPFVHHLLWQDVFSEKYGNAPEPTYLAIKLPVKVTNKSSMNDLINSMPDEKISEKMNKFLDRAGKTEIKKFRLPLVNIKTKGIPDELKEHIDLNSIVSDNCRVLYMILESIGFYLKPGVKVNDVLDIYEKEKTKFEKENK